MANMSYCRFQNTLNDLRDCANHMSDCLSKDEADARQKLIAIAHDISSNYGPDDELPVEADEPDDGTIIADDWLCFTSSISQTLVCSGHLKGQHWTIASLNTIAAVEARGMVLITRSIRLTKSTGNIYTKPWNDFGFSHLMPIIPKAGCTIIKAHSTHKKKPSLARLALAICIMRFSILRIAVSLKPIPRNGQRIRSLSKDPTLQGYLIKLLVCMVLQLFWFFVKKMLTRVSLMVIWLHETTIKKRTKLCQRHLERDWEQWGIECQDGWKNQPAASQVQQGGG